MKKTNKKLTNKAANDKKMQDLKKYTKEAVSIYEKALRKLAYT